MAAASLHIYGVPVPRGYRVKCVAAKKGRQAASNATNTAGSIAGTNRTTQQGMLGMETPFLQNSSTTQPNGLSTSANAQYEQDKRNIDQSYGDATRVAEKNLAYRGMDQAPSGMLASVINTNNRNAGEARTNAFENAQKNTYGQQAEAANLEQGLQGIYNPLPAVNTQLEGANMQSKMGSTLGDIGTGLTSLAGGFAGIGTGLAGLKKAGMLQGQG